MSTSTPAEPSPRWVLAAAWSVALSISAVGVAAALATASWMPLLTVSGLAVPLLLVPRRRDDRATR